MTTNSSESVSTATRTISTGKGVLLPTYLANVEGLSAHSRAAAVSAAELRQRLNRSQSLYKIVDTYKAVTGIMEPVTRGADEIPVDATQLMISNINYAVNGKQIIDSKIDSVSKQAGSIILELASHKKVRIEMESNISRGNHNLRLYVDDKLIQTVNEFDNPVKDGEDALDLLMGITGYMADGMVAASSLDKVKYCDIPPVRDKQDKYAQKLGDTFSRLHNNLEPVPMATPRVEVKRVEPIPGFNAVVGSALASLLVELKTQGRSELAQDFIDFVSNPAHDLKSQVDSLWDFSNIKNKREAIGYMTYGDLVERQLNSAIVNELGYSNGVGNLSSAERTAYLGQRMKIIPAFMALKGILITADLAKKNNFAEMGRDYGTWNDKLNLYNYFFEMAKSLAPGPGSTTLSTDAQRIRSVLAKNIAKSMGEILPDNDTSSDYKTIKQNLSGI